MLAWAASPPANALEQATWCARARDALPPVCEGCRAPRPCADERAATWALLGELRLRGGGGARPRSAGPRVKRGEEHSAAAGIPELPAFRYVPYEEKGRRRSQGGGDHRKSKWRRGHQEEENEPITEGEIDVGQLMEIDEDRVNALLQRQHTSAKSMRRKEARKKEKDTSTTLERIARLDPRKRSGEEWVNAEMRGQSFHDMRQQVIEARKRMGQASLVN